MKSGWLLLGCLSLAACNITVDNDEKSGDLKNIHVSIAGFGGIKGNGHQITANRPLTAVNDVDIAGPLDVTIHIGSEPSLTVAADENLVEHIETEQHGQRLVIRAKRPLSSEQRIKVTVVTPSLAHLKNTGSGSVLVEGLKDGDLQVEATGSGETQLSGQLKTLTARLVGSGDLIGQQLSPASVKVDVLGSGDVRLGKIEVDSFDASVKGSGSVAAEGKAKSVKGSVMGSGDLRLESLQALTADLQVMGSGDIAAYASESVQADAKGSGDIVVHGKPAKQQLSGKHVSLAS